jgi:hypothetical protein
MIRNPCINNGQISLPALTFQTQDPLAIPTLTEPTRRYTFDLYIDLVDES